MKNKYKSKKGGSLLIVIGNYGGFHIQISSNAFHICLAFFAVTIFFYDVENAMGMILESEHKTDIDARDSNYNIFDVSNSVCGKGLTWDNCSKWTKTGKCDNSCEFYKN